jgi:hypothetical protein
MVNTRAPEACLELQVIGAAYAPDAPTQAAANTANFSPRFRMVNPH